MSDETTTTYADFMRDAKGPVGINYPKKHVLLTKVRQYDSRKFGGEQVRCPIVTGPLQGAGLVSQLGTVNEPHTLDTDKALIKVPNITMPMSITRRLELDSADNDGSWKAALGLKIQVTTQSLARVENELLNGDGTTLTAAVTATNSGSTTVDVGTDANWRDLYVGRVVDVRVRATGDLVVDGARRKITARSKTAGEVTVDVAISTDNTMGLYLEGSYANDVAYQGIQQIYAVTGTFEGIDKATAEHWQGTDGRDGVTTPVDLSEVLLDGAERRVDERTDETPTFYLGDPAAIDKYAQSHYILQRYGADLKTVDTGFDGVRYRHKMLFGDFSHKRKALTGLNTNYLSRYVRGSGPDWFTFAEGGMFRQFNRSYVKEAWLSNDCQLGAHRCDVHVFIHDLNQAA